MQSKTQGIGTSTGEEKVMDQIAGIVLVIAFVGFVIYQLFFAKKLGGDKIIDKPKPPVDKPRK